MSRSGNMKTKLSVSRFMEKNGSCLEPCSQEKLRLDGCEFEDNLGYTAISFQDKKEGGAGK